jgi:glucosylceramidase
VRVKSSVSGGSGATALSAVAFRTPAGRYVVLALNDGTTTQRFGIAFGGRMVTHSLSAGSVATYVW